MCTQANCLSESAIATKQTKIWYKVLQFALYLVASKDIQNIWHQWIFSFPSQDIFKDDYDVANFCSTKHV